MPPRLDLTGRKFGRWKVLNFSHMNRHKNTCWLCECECGKRNTVIGTSLTRGHSKSCGCFFRDEVKRRNTTHALSNTNLHGTWNHMRDRCCNPKHAQYKYYGGRGITVCDEWRKDFLSFYNWAMANGYGEGLTIDRIDNDGNYEPNNCRWATRKEQMNNTSRNIIVFYNAEEMTLQRLCELSGIPYSTLYKRYYKGDRGKLLVRPPR